MHHVIFPADPDCPECHGSGQLFHSEKRSYGFMAESGPCGCRRLENIAKIRERCEHEYRCVKCGKMYE